MAGANGKDVGVSSDVSASPAVGDDRRCGACRRRVSLVESLMKCRCSLIFCERHRPPESHSCNFDWHAEHQEKIARENPRVFRSASSLSTIEGWIAEYGKFHPTACAGERNAQQLHSLGALIFAMMAGRGLLLSVINGSFQPLLQNLVLGYLMGLASCHFAPRLLLGRPSRECRFCAFSWDALSMPQWCVVAEWECMKELMIFAITSGKTNCLTRRLWALCQKRLYDGPRTVSHIVRTVSDRVLELMGGQARCC
eukprot:TRINITY_DN20267_c0_g1_i1.p1 TRINITY_DN20267_c0_g1~~TRINITY_DN20267_c0_g1_i1.p1  ORF type:complete len:265 (-),score=40.32 TRINITY_DN20267_c0_g1_i1:63-824(-)